MTVMVKFEDGHVPEAGSIWQVDENLILRPIERCADCSLNRMLAAAQKLMASQKEFEELEQKLRRDFTPPVGFD